MGGHPDGHLAQRPTQGHADGVGRAGRAREWVATQMDTSRNVTVSMFETTIRIIGGLLAAYDLADDALLLARARALADKVLINFRVTGRGTPRTQTHQLSTNVSEQWRAHVCVCGMHCQDRSPV